MNRRVLAAALGLAVAGCAQDRSVQKQAEQGMPPVGLDPIPSIYDTINGGLRGSERDVRLAGRAPDPTQPPGEPEPRADGPGQPGTDPIAIAEASQEGTPGGRPAPHADQTHPSGRKRARASASAVASTSPQPAASAESAPPSGNAESLPMVAEAPAADTIATTEPQPTPSTGAPEPTASGLPLPVAAEPVFGPSKDTRPVAGQPTQESPLPEPAKIAAGTGDTSSPNTAPAPTPVELPMPAEATPTPVVASAPEPAKEGPVPSTSAPSEPVSSAPADSKPVPVVAKESPAETMPAPLPADSTTPAPAPQPQPAVAAAAPVTPPPAESEASKTQPKDSAATRAATSPAPMDLPPLPGVAPSEAKPDQPAAKAAAPVVAAPIPVSPSTTQAAPGDMPPLPDAPPLPAEMPPAASPAPEPAPAPAAPTTSAPSPAAGTMPPDDLPPLPESSPIPARGSEPSPKAGPSAPPAADPKDLPPLPAETTSPVTLPPLPDEATPTVTLPPLPGETTPSIKLPPLPPESAPTDLPPLPDASAPAPASPASRLPANQSSPPTQTRLQSPTTQDTPDQPPAGPNPLLPARRTASQRPPLASTPDAAAPSDASVRPASTTASSSTPSSNQNDPTAVRTELRARPSSEYSEVAARVGEEIITLRELRRAYAETKKKCVPDGHRLTPEETDQLARMALDNLIDRSLILQEAKRLMKSPKQWDKFKEFASQAWLEDELPPLLRRYAASNVYELKQKLNEKGKSLDEMREEFVSTRMSREFVNMKVYNKLSVDLPVMRDYYNANLKKFDRPAEITWREVVVEVSRYPSRADARRKAEAVLAKLRRGDDFATVAKAESEGPTAGEGGLWKTGPGSLAEPALNQALDTAALNQVSSIIEGPTSFHILRVEARRNAGPARFDEVQEKIRETLIEQIYERETKALIEKLRDQTLVTTKFDEVPPTETAAAAPAAPATRAPAAASRR